MTKIDVDSRMQKMSSGLKIHKNSNVNQKFTCNNDANQRFSQQVLI